MVVTVCNVVHLAQLLQQEITCYWLHHDVDFLHRNAVVTRLLGFVIISDVSVTRRLDMIISVFVQ